MIALVFLAGQASAQDAYLARWRQLRNAQPGGVKFTIAASKSTFYLGEIVPLQLSFSSSQPGAFTAGRAYGMNLWEQFVVDPATSIDALQDFFRGGRITGRGPTVLSADPLSIERTLNESVRFRVAGTYRIYAQSNRVSRVTELQHANASLPRHDEGSRIAIVSNILTLTIRPAPPEWVKARLSSAAAILHRPRTPGAQAARERLNAAQTLCFLDTPEAAIELANYWAKGADGWSSVLTPGILGSRHRRQLLSVLEARLVAPDQPVSDSFLDTLAELAAFVAAPSSMLPSAKDEPRPRASVVESKRRLDVHLQKKGEYVARLVASLPTKDHAGLPECLITLLNIGAVSRPRPQWFPRVTALLMEHFLEIEPASQDMLLQSFWDLLKHPAIVPILRQIYSNPPPNLGRWHTDLVLQRLYDLAPDEGRRIIIDEIRHPSGRTWFPILAMLPDRSLTELDEGFASGLETRRGFDLAITRYASAAIVKRLEQAYERRAQQAENEKAPRRACPLVFYFLQYDPPFGERELRRAFSPDSPDPSCLDIGSRLNDLGPTVMSPALERLAIEYLSSPVVRIKNGAAQILGRYGSVAAKDPLWKTLEYFRSWWKGHEEELQGPNGQEGRAFEITLITALARSGTWTLNEQDMHRLLSLCSSPACRQQVSAWQAAPVRR